METQWVGYELHPETPLDGVFLSKLIPGYDSLAMTQKLNTAGAPYGISFGARESVSNSRLALEASEFARDHGRFEELHNLIFRAYFQQGENIGALATLCSLSTEAGLDSRSLSLALENGVYRERVRSARDSGEKYMVTGLPTFIFNGVEKIVGAVPYDAFLKVLARLS